VRESRNHVLSASLHELTPKGARELEELGLKVEVVLDGVAKFQVDINDEFPHHFNQFYLANVRYQTIGFVVKAYRYAYDGSHPLTLGRIEIEPAALREVFSTVIPLRKDNQAYGSIFITTQSYSYGLPVLIYNGEAKPEPMANLDDGKVQQHTRGKSEGQVLFYLVLLCLLMDDVISPSIPMSCAPSVNFVFDDVDLQLDAARLAQFWFVVTEGSQVAGTGTAPVPSPVHAQHQSFNRLAALGITLHFVVSTQDVHLAFSAPFRAFKKLLLVHTDYRTKSKVFKCLYIYSCCYRHTHV
jgi:hypothetical protein